MSLKPIYIFLAIIHFINSQNLPAATCEGRTLRYSIATNLTNYLESLTKNNSEIENKTFYNNQDDLKEKKGGIVKGTIYESLAKKNNSLNNYSLYDSYEDAQKALNSHSIEYFLSDKEITGEYIKINDENSTYLGIDQDNNNKEYDSYFVMSKDFTKRTEIEKFINDTLKDQYNGLLNNWLGDDDGLKYINKTNDNTKQNLSVLLNFNQKPYAYKENNQQKGLIVQKLYDFANENDLNLILNETNTVEDLLPSVVNGSVNASIGYFINNEIRNNDSINYIPTFLDSNRAYVIRYDNSENSTQWLITNSVRDFNGKNLSCFTGQKDSIQNIFPNSNIDNSTNSTNILFNNLLKKDIDGVIIDKNILDVYLKNNDRISFYEDKLADNSYGLLFTNEAIRNEFNNFLKSNFSATSLNNLFNEWKNADSNKKIDSTLTGTKNLEVSFPNIRPMCYYENGEYKGYELDLLYRFANKSGYNLIINSDDSSSEGKVSIGCQNITSDGNRVYYSTPILNSSSVLAVRKDNKKSTLNTLPIVALDGNYREKNGNNIDIPVEISGSTKTSSCKLPDTFYSDIIILNCTVPDLSESQQINSTNFKMGNSTDRIKILYSTIKADNLLNSNSLFPGNNIISQSPMNNIVCSTPSSNTDRTENSTINTPIISKKSSGLSTGGIIAIAIPCILALLGAAILAATCKGGSSAATTVHYPMSSSTQIIENSMIPINNQVTEIPNTNVVSQVPIPVASTTNLVTKVPVAQVPVTNVVTQVPVAQVPVTNVVTQVPVNQVPVTNVVTQVPVAQVPVTNVVTQVPVAQVPVTEVVTQVPVHNVVTQVPVNNVVAQVPTTLQSQIPSSTIISNVSSSNMVVQPENAII